MMMAATISGIYELTFFGFRYGYFDINGELQEFTYESGIPCDPDTKQPLDPALRQSSAASPRKSRGYFDYNLNRFVMPNGKTVKVVVNQGNRRRGGV